MGYLIIILDTAYHTFRGRYVAYQCKRDTVLLQRTWTVSFWFYYNDNDDDEELSDFGGI